jgi:ATP-dependent DNA helicase RecG
MLPALSCLRAIPPIKFPGCKTRFLRFEGEHEHNGSSLNAVKDVTFEGPVPSLILQTARLVDSQLRTFSKLGTDGKFYTDPEYPPGAWYEAIVNACVPPFLQHEESEYFCQNVR